MAVEPLREGDEAGQRQEAADRQDHQHGRVLRRQDAHAVGREDALAERAAAEQLADDAHAHKGHGVADALRQAVDGGGQHAVLRGEGLGAAENDAVDDDERDEHAEALGQGREISLQQKVDDGDKARDDDDVGRNADLIRNDLAQHGDDDVRADEDQRDGQAHAEAVEQGRRDGHGRAHAQQLAHDGVIGQEPLAELFFKIHFCTSPA